MKKGISPLVASVLLIAITMAVAAIIAAWVSSYTQQQLPTATCIGGSVNYVTADYPKWDEGTSKIIGVIEAQNTALGRFTFELLLTNSTVISSDDTQGLSLKPGATGTVISGTIPVGKANIDKVRLTSNCSNVYIDYTTLK